jgi:hypothetical protein
MAEPVELAEPIEPVERVGSVGAAELARLAAMTRVLAMAVTGSALGATPKQEAAISDLQADSWLRFPLGGPVADLAKT